MKLTEITSPDTLTGALGGEFSLICCGTSWSIPCRKQKTILQRLAEEDSRWDCIAVLDIEKCPDAVNRWTIQSIPTTIALRSGREAGRLVGVKSCRRLQAALDMIFPPALAERAWGCAETTTYSQSSV